METKTPGFNENLDILEKEIQASLVKDRLPCAVAFTITEKLDVSPGMVGDKVNELKIRITNCQLGCFAVEKATRPGLDNMEIAAALAEELQAAMIDRQLPCSAAFEVARKLKVSRKQVGDAATKLNIMLIDCQLGCF
ncbi:MAG: hypothetical protein KKF26_08030 [Chloroflexi bacterium]|nr:hypothetical protein [Chloroflexota bacterium]